MQTSRKTTSRPPGLIVRTRRCAIYTRKSTEEGLDQAFNSLDAQREACEAYIASQKHEGWQAVRARYDDGGYSGGTMDRPALARLLADVANREIDAIVVYKVDRLTRSLADFAKIVEVLDAQDVSFVSVTQQFNTTTSMGRLTLNVLLSFAQFEREVTGERIRDKIAASKKKGMWMGGSPPLGYDARDKKLVVNEPEAETVRVIYQRYIDLRSINALKEALDAESIVSKARTDRDGGTRGAKPIMRGALYRMLQNRTYLGEVAHNGAVYPGEHPAIVDRGLWNQAQHLLDSNRVERVTGRGFRHPSLLAGLIHDAHGDPMTPTHAVKGGVRYRYYVSRDLTVAHRSPEGTGRRVPAPDVEAIVVRVVQKYLADDSAVFDALQTGVPDPESRQRLASRAVYLAQGWDRLTAPEMRAFLLKLLVRVDVRAESIDVNLFPSGLSLALDQAAPPSEVGQRPQLFPSETRVISMPVRVRSSAAGPRMIVIGNDGVPVPDPGLIRLVARAHAFRSELLAGKVEAISDIARRERLARVYVTRLLRISFLAPDITSAMLDGRQPAGVTVMKLLRGSKVPLDWQAQRQALGFV